MRREVVAKVRKGTIEVRTHPMSVYAGALGAALWGGFRHERFEAREATVRQADLTQPAVQLDP